MACWRGVCKACCRFGGSPLDSSFDDDSFDKFRPLTKEIEACAEICTESLHTPRISWDIVQRSDGFDVVNENESTTDDATLSKESSEDSGNLSSLSIHVLDSSETLNSWSTLAMDSSENLSSWSMSMLDTDSSANLSSFSMHVMEAMLCLPCGH